MGKILLAIIFIFCFASPQLWGVALCIAIPFIIALIPPRKKMDYAKINVSKMLNDKVQNNLSDAQVRRNWEQGKYDYHEGDFDLYKR